MKSIGIGSFFLLFLFSKAQIQPIGILDNTLKVGCMKEKVFYYAFAKGDQLVFSFQEKNNRFLKEIEITEYPFNSRFMEYKSKRIENKNILIPRTGIYSFRLKNGGVLGRIVHVKIDRIPHSDSTISFNTAVKWIEKIDTVWKVFTKDVVTGYDTLRIKKTRRILVKSELKEELIMTKDEHIGASFSNNKASLFFSLPQRIFLGNNTKRVVSWAYWVGVGEEANKAWIENTKILCDLVKGTTSFLTTGLGGLLAGKITELIIPKTGEDVSYSIVDAYNKDLFLQGAQYMSFDSGKGRAGYQKFVDNNMLQGTWYITLYNDNLFQSINVNVKIVALIELNTYENQPYTEVKITPRYESKIFKEPIIKNTKTPIATKD